MRVRKMKTAELEQDPQNAKQHNGRNIEAIARSLLRFGQQKPILVSGNRVIAGNGTLTAALSLGWEQIAVVESELSEEELRAYAVVDNRTGELGSWDEDLLLASLPFLGDDVSSFWTDAELELILEAVDELPSSDPDSDLTPPLDIGPENLVTFQFGKLKAQVERGLYERFVDQLETDREEAGQGILFTELFRRWLERASRAHELS